jgi:beta-phosphoglucomutase
MNAILFDLDGTMINNMMIHHRAWQQTLRELGLDWSIEQVKESIHGINTEILERIFGDRFNAEQRTAISWEKEAAYRNIFLPDLKLIDGLPEFLQTLQANNIPMAIASAAPPENVNFVLDHLDLHQYFPVVYHSDLVSKGKPDPEVFHKAAADLGVPIEKCWVFEDSIVGAAAAKNAGSPAVIVTTTHTREEFAEFSHIHKFISNYREISFFDLFH